MNSPDEPSRTGNLPEIFVERLRCIIDASLLDSVLASFSTTRKTGFRINTLKTSPADGFAALNTDGIRVHPVQWCDHAGWVEPDLRSQLTHSKSVTEGKVYVQGLSSILATLVLDPAPGEWNLDLAAAPGGKASHIVARMNNEGHLSVVEPIRKRMYRLADNLKRLGSSISKTYLMDGRKVGQKVPERFDRVMLDAPCSSEARMRTFDPESMSFWSERKIREQSRKQAGLIESGFQSLKPGGILLYCTCSFAPEENEAIVSQFLENNDFAEILPIELPIANIARGITDFRDRQFHPQVTACRRILPNDFFDGFFLARIRKRVES